MVETYSIEKDMFIDFDVEQFIDDYEIVKDSNKYDF